VPIDERAMRNAVDLSFQPLTFIASNPQAQPWQTQHVRDSDQGPMVWEAKRVAITLKDEDDLPALSLELLAARDVRDRENVKARESHWRSALAELGALGVQLSRIIRCRWNKR
jgi:hypothetical protein